MLLFSYGLYMLVRYASPILCLMCFWSSLHVECILHLCMLCLSVWRMVFAVCMYGGVRMSEKAASVSVVSSLLSYSS